MYYCLYKVTNKINGKIYIGAHKTKNLDDGYLGTGILISKAIKKYGKENFEKEILQIFNNADAMYLAEFTIVNEEFLQRTDVYNIGLGGKGPNIYSTEMITVKDAEGKKSKVSKDDPRYLSGELISVYSGKLSVKDKNGNVFRINKDDPRYISGELVSIMKGRIVVKDKNGKKFSVNKDDPRYISGELVSIHKGKVTVRDKNGKCFNVSKDDPRYLSRELVYNVTGLTYSEETKKKKSLSIKKYIADNKAPTLGKIWMHNKQLQKRSLVDKKNIQSLLDSGWIFGKGKFNN